MELSSIANELVSLEENIILVYAFNATGKTRLSVSYKDKTKEMNDDNKGHFKTIFTNFRNEYKFNEKLFLDEII